MSVSRLRCVKMRCLKQHNFRPRSRENNKKRFYVYKIRISPRELTETFTNVNREHIGGCIFRKRVHPIRQVHCTRTYLVSRRLNSSLQFVELLAGLQNRLCGVYEVV